MSRRFFASRKRVKSTLAIISLVIAILAVQPVNKSVLGHSGTINPLSAWASNAPTIDGEISLPVILSYPGGLMQPIIVQHGEWEDAESVNFTLTYRGEVHDAALYVMNDWVNLYLALRIHGEDYNIGDQLKLEFDNTHNGVRDVGENVLSLHGDSWYSDRFVNDATSGSTQSDESDGGTQDGVGGVKIWKPGIYDFEIAFPLLSGDSTHDFILSPGLLPTVGLLLSFFDYDGPGDVAGDTWPSSSYDQMIDITIAMNPTAPSGSWTDLSIAGVEVTQAIQLLDNSMPLVEGKATVVRVYIDIVPYTFYMDVEIFLYGLDGYFGTSLGALSMSFSAPGTINRMSTFSAANFLLPMSWVNRGSLTLTAFVRAASDSQWETAYDNNWFAEQTFTFDDLSVPTIYIVPVNIGSTASPNTVSSAFITNQEEYFQTVFPLADINFIQLAWPAIGPNAPLPGSQLNSMLTELGYWLGLADAGLNQIYGMTPTAGAIGGLADALWGGGHGFAACGWLGTSLEGTMAHEINHNWGPETWGRHVDSGFAEPGPDPNWPYPNGTIQEVGFDTQNMEAVFSSTWELMTYRQSLTPPTKWISPYRWENMFYRLGGSSASASTGMIQQAGESMMISGWVSQNGTGSLNPIFYLPNAPELPSSTGSYSLILKDSVGTPLITKNFEAQYMNVDGAEEDPYYFTMLVPYEAGSTSVLLTFKNMTILDEIIMSKNAPSVNILAPSGGEIWNAALQTVSWQAADADDDPLSYRVYYSADAGSSWTPLSPAITERWYQIDASQIPGGNTSLVRVVASDGFNTGQDESDAVFTVVDKPPTAKILQPQNGSQFNMNHVILLRGKGFDADDLTLKAAAFNWTSNLDGYLGSGSTLTTMLTPGTHQVTLTISDSKGNSANDTVTIIVTMDIEITSITPSKTVVGQGLSMPINVTVENRCSVTRTFNITAAASNTKSKTTFGVSAMFGALGIIGDVPLVTLAPGNSTTLELLWNTTDVAKGNYTVSITVSLVEYEMTGFSDNVIVALVGDVTGSGGLPDGKVDILDIASVARLFGVIYPNPRYVPNYDIIYNGKIDIQDIATAAIHFGEVDP